MGTVQTIRRSGTVFEPRQLAAIGRAYDKACAALHFENRSSIVKEALAAEIIALASHGTCDADYLCDTTVARMMVGASEVQPRFLAVSDMVDASRRL